jgi:hypothetical protein
MPGRPAATRALASGGVLPGLLAAAVAHAAPAVAPAAAPAAGRYEGRLCVATAKGAPECGPAHVELRRAGLAIVRVSDMLYSLTLQSSQVDVVLKHGAMQIDGFTGVYEWKGTALHFVDAGKGVRYEVHFSERQRGPH